MNYEITQTRVQTRVLDQVQGMESNHVQMLARPRPQIGWTRSKEFLDQVHFKGLDQVHNVFTRTI